MQTDEQVEHELLGRLRIDGKWHGRGEKVMLDKADAEVYRLRGFSRPTVPKKQVANATKMPASEVGMITKASEEPAKVEPPPVKQDEAPMKSDQPVHRVEPESTNGKLRGKGR